MVRHILIACLLAALTVPATPTLAGCSKGYRVVGVHRTRAAFAEIRALIKKKSKAVDYFVKTGNDGEPPRLALVFHFDEQAAMVTFQRAVEGLAADLNPVRTHRFISPKVLGLVSTTALCTSALCGLLTYHLFKAGPGSTEAMALSAFVTALLFGGSQAVEQVRWGMDPPAGAKAEAKDGATVARFFSEFFDKPVAQTGQLALIGTTSTLKAPEAVTGAGYAAISANEARTLLRKIQSANKLIGDVPLPSDMYAPRLKYRLLRVESERSGQWAAEQLVGFGMTEEFARETLASAQRAGQEVFFLFDGYDQRRDQNKPLEELKAIGALQVNVVRDGDNATRYFNEYNWLGLKSPGDVTRLSEQVRGILERHVSKAKARSAEPQ